MLTNQYDQKKKLIYVSSPYTALGDYSDEVKKLIRNSNWHEVCEVASKFQTKYYKTHIFFCPIAQSHPISLYMTPELKANQEMWLDETDYYWVLASDEVWVVCMSGWQESYGVTQEINLAHEFKIPVRYFNTEGKEITYEQALELK